MLNARTRSSTGRGNRSVSARFSSDFIAHSRAARERFIGSCLALLEVFVGCAGTQGWRYFVILDSFRSSRTNQSTAEWPAVYHVSLFDYTRIPQLPKSCQGLAGKYQVTLRRTPTDELHDASINQARCIRIFGTGSLVRSGRAQ